MHSGARDTLCRTACSHNRKTNATFARIRQNSTLTRLSVGPRHPRLMVPWYPRWLAIAATHNQNTDGGSIGKRHRSRRPFSARCGFQRFVGNLVLKSSITVVERSVVIIHAHDPDLVSVSYKQRSA